MNSGSGVVQDTFISSLVSESDLYIKQILSQFDGDLQNVLWEFMRDGKRLRPFILACISRMLNGDRTIATRLAASVEIYHNTTLIFDDIQDNSLLRRGKPTVNAQFGSAVAISFASVLRSMITKPFADLLPVKESLILYQWINKVAVMLSLGQFREMMWSYKKDLNISEKDYLEMARFKTGALLGLASHFGGISAGSLHIEKLFEFGCNLGIAYQIYDDIGNVDVKIKQHKDKFSDIYSRKVTLLIVHSVENKDGKWKNDIMNIFSKDEIEESDVQLVLQIINDSEALDYSIGVANYYIQNAIDILMQIPEADSGFRERFINEIKEIFIHA